MSGHTPGPWEVCSVPANDYWQSGVTIGAADPEDARRVCDVFTCGATGDDIHSMHKANARLIAAAPDLLDLIVAMQDDYQDILASGRPTGSSDHLMTRAQALIAKATQP